MKWGIMATGSIARKFATTVNQMKEEGQCLVAVASRTTEKAAAFAEEFHIPTALDSYKALAENDHVEAVYIATPNNMHYENAKMCLMAGKHVLCEKPFTTNASQAAELYRLAEMKGLFIMEAFWIRFLPVLDRLQQLITTNTIGDVKYVRSDYGFIANGTRKDRKFDSALGGGALLDIGIYNLGFVQMIMKDAPTTFTSSVHINDYNTDDFSIVTLEYSNNRSAVITTSIGLNIPREAAIIGTKGSIFLPDFQKAETMTIRPNTGDSYDISIPFDINGFEYEIREMQRCVEKGLSASSIFTPKDSVTVLQTLDDIRASWNMKFSYEDTPSATSNL